MNQKLVPLGYNQITASATPVGLGEGLADDAVPAGATVALVTVRVAAVRWRDDGVAPTTSVGNPVAETEPGFWYWGNLRALLLIAQTGSPIVSVSFYKAVG